MPDVVPTAGLAYFWALGELATCPEEAQECLAASAPQPVPASRVPAGSVLSQQYVALCTNHHGSSSSHRTLSSQCSRDVDTRKQREDGEVGKIMPSGQVGLAAACAPLVVTVPKVTHGEGAGLRSCLFKEKRAGLTQQRSQHKITPTKGNEVGVLPPEKEIDWRKGLPLNFLESRLCLH